MKRQAPKNKAEFEARRLRTLRRQLREERAHTRQWQENATARALELTDARAEAQRAREHSERIERYRKDERVTRAVESVDALTKNTEPGMFEAVIAGVIHKRAERLRAPEVVKATDGSSIVGVALEPVQPGDFVRIATRGPAFVGIAAEPGKR
jgi:hypothetical protein